MSSSESGEDLVHSFDPKYTKLKESRNFINITYDHLDSGPENFRLGEFSCLSSMP
jgi:hypothetical protein